MKILNLLNVTIFLLCSVLYIINISSIQKLIFGKSKTKIKIFPIICYLLSAVLLILSELYIINGNLRLLYFTFYYVMLVLSVKRNYSYKSTIYIVLMYITVDSILQSCTFIILGSIAEKINTNLIMRLITLSINLAYIIVYEVLLKHKQIKTDINIISNKIYILILASLVVCGGLAGNQIVDIPSRNNDIQIKLSAYLTAICIYMLILIIISLLINCITKNYYQNTSSVLEKQVNMQLDYYNKLEKKNAELREFRHDFKNHMLCLQALIENCDYEEASQYIQKITNRSYSEAPKYYTGNKLADAILADKSTLAKEINTEITFDGEIYDGISAPDICIILSNALDNAVEACAKISDTDKRIRVRCIFSKGVQIINISNPVAETADFSNNSIKTTKEDKNNHGFGLYNIKKTADMYNGTFSVKCEEGLFTLEVGLNIAGNISKTPK